MRINLTTDYAFRTIKCIYQSGGITTSKRIAEEEGISQGVLMKILYKLKEGRLIESHQGRGNISGGFTLRCPLNQMTILDIVEIMEGPIEMAVASFPQKTPADQGINDELRRITEEIRGEMRRYTIEDLVKSGL